MRFIDLHVPAPRALETVRTPLADVTVLGGFISIENATWHSIDFTVAAQDGADQREVPGAARCPDRKFVQSPELFAPEHDVQHIGIRHYQQPAVCRGRWPPRNEPRSWTRCRSSKEGWGRGSWGGGPYGGGYWHQHTLEPGGPTAPTTTPTPTTPPAGGEPEQPKSA